ncbi:MAG: GNAT family N-acetyltransferase [Lachnospiraceae bacterium]|nr:GNAT family N-acetyltransferase [Lachnospiraceae bacterium]
MIKIETERLLLHPISDEEMQKIIDDEKNPEMQKAYSEMLQGCLDNPEDRVWFATWNMELKNDPQTIVGDLSFKGITDDGMVEIGYGLKEGYCGNGYMTEAVRAISEWALSQNKVSRVEAETDPDNLPSKRILANVGFVPTGEVGEEGPRFVLEKKITVCGKEYRIIKLLGHGKGGYSYLADQDGQKVVLKQMHHEPCDYYTFGNKIQAEKNDYERITNAGVRAPKMLAIDIENERIVKEYVDGKTIFDLILEGTSVEQFLLQVRTMAKKAFDVGLNIDYFPTNFVIQDGLLWYVDYECNDYMAEWNFDNWGIRYWSKTPEFEEYLRELKMGRYRQRRCRR